MSISGSPTGLTPVSPELSSPVYVVSPYSSDEIRFPLTEAPEEIATTDPVYPRHPEQTSRTKVPKNRSSLNLVHMIDLRAVTYDGPVDENLVCPICHCPLVDPVMTECDHIFCRACIEQSVIHSQACPIDRLPLTEEVDSMKRAPKIVLNLLNDLKAKCPCCSASFARSMLDNHMEKYCPESTMRCPGRNTEKGCQESVKRKHSPKGCLHYESNCPDCQKTMLEVDMEDHRGSKCKDRFRECEHCGSEILRLKVSEHERECPDVIAPCQWAGYGCPHEAKRKDLHLHLDECNLKTVGPLTDMLKREINELRTEVRTLTDANQRQERRIKFMEGGSARDFHQPIYSTDISSPSSLANMLDTANAEPLDSGHQYLLSLLETQESNLSHLSSSLTESEAKQTTMLFNETIPIKNELAEIRSMQQTTSMHVRWLMRFRIQENSRRAGGGPGIASNGASSYSSGGTESAGASGSDSLLPRRLSDSMSRDLVTKL
ncbi:TRAF-like signal transducer [Diplocarpon rosae]|nr:TRAF-like signal transducer [Diplocarpon rosae]